MDERPEQEGEDHRGQPDLQQCRFGCVHCVLPAALRRAAERIQEQDGHALPAHRRAGSAVEEPVAVSQVVELVVRERLVEAAQDEQGGHHDQQQRGKHAAQHAGGGYRAGQ